MYQIIYRSTTPRHLDTEALMRILTRSREFNTRYGITGCLLYDGQTFLQLLEGPKDVVSILYERVIIPDPKHRDCELVAERQAPKRIFDQWRMGFYHMKMLDRQMIDGLMQASLDDLMAVLDHEPCNMKGSMPNCMELDAQHRCVVRVRCWWILLPVRCPVTCIQSPHEPKHRSPVHRSPWAANPIHRT
jgi:hypothetical protein